MSSTALALYYPKADVVIQNYDDAGFPYGPLSVDDAAIKFLVHSTEGFGWPDYRGGRDAPHITVRADLANQRTLFRQHFSFDRYARALATDNGLLINNGGAIQIEIVGTAGWASSLNPAAPYQVPMYVPNLPQWFWDDLAEFFAWCHRHLGVALEIISDGFYPWDAPGPRLEYEDWLGFSGLLGHQQAPRPNNHVDPGAIPGGYLLEKARAIAEGRIGPVAKTKADALALERELRARGFTIYCGPSHHYSGVCRKGNHAHDPDSMHWQGLAIDAGMDPASGAAISNYERAHLDRLAREKHGIGWRTLWNVAVGNHQDHVHFDGSNWASVINYTGVTGITLKPGSFPDLAGAGGLGFSGAYIKDIQRDLNTLLAAGVLSGFKALTVDGSPGPSTQEAVKVAQRTFDLVADGLPGPTTRAMIDRMLAAIKFNEGFAPDYVEEVQADLNRLLAAGALTVKGISKLAVDGSLGTQARTVVSAFQKWKGLAVDGLPGPGTRKALTEAVTDLAKKPIPAPAPAPTPPVANYGFPLTYIKEVQRDLNRLLEAKVVAAPSLPVLTVTGTLDHHTQTVVRAYQVLRRLAVDGMPGNATRTALDADIKALDSRRPLGERLLPFRVYGATGQATADKGNTWTPPAGKGVVVVARDTPDHPSAVHALARAGRRDVAVLVVHREGDLGGVNIKAVEREKPSWVVAFGGPASVSDAALYAALNTARVAVPD